MATLIISGSRGTDDPTMATLPFMEFGLGEALPIYSGGLGILAGDYLKTASDLGVPVVGVGLLYQQGYFRQILDPDGRQQEVFPYNDPTSLPVTPVQNREGGWLRIRLELPGRAILVRVWQAQVGRAKLYLFDSNDQLNSPADRGASALLYPSGARPRLTQEIILGMNEEFGSKSTKDPTAFSRQVSAKAARKIKAQRHDAAAEGRRNRSTAE